MEKAGLKLNIQKMKIMAYYHFMASRLGNSGNTDTLNILGPKPMRMVTAAMKL